MSQNASFKIKRRDDLIPAAVALKFRITSSNNGKSVVQVVNDIATTVSSVQIEGLGLTGNLQTPTNFVADNATYIAGGTQTAMQAASRTFAAQTTTIDMEGGQSLSATIGAVPVDVGDPGSDSGALTFWTTLFPELKTATNLALYDAAGAPATVLDQTDTPVNLSTYNYRLTTGQIAPWMTSTGGQPGVAVKCTVTAKFTYTQNTADGSNTIPNSTVPCHEKTASITLTNLAGGTYGITSAGEVVPYGLAGYIYNIEQVPQYEGTFTLQETEVSDQCPMGNNLNLTGGLAEWSTMNACVQSITYDLVKGATTLTFGPAGHLGAKDFVERLRVNRGPRWYYEIGGNITNAAGASGALGSYTPDQGPSHNNAIFSVTTDSPDVPDWLAHNSAYTAGAPGITRDTTGLIDYTGLGAPNAPLIHLADGSGGAINSFAHLNATGALVLQDDNDDTSATIQVLLSDIPDGFDWGTLGVIKFREVKDCVVISGTPTTVYRQALVSEYYTTSLGNS
jgi:hypothetical protein